MKDNQPGLHQRILEKLSPQMLALEQGRMTCTDLKERALRYAEQTHKGHGRLERRQWLGVAVNDGSWDWPHAEQVGLVRRQRTVKGRSSVEYAAFVTSLSPQAADAADLLSLSRDHWGIENSLHYVRDVSLGEDASRIRSGHAPVNMAALRNTSITLCHDAGHKSIAAATRRYAARYHEAINLARGP